MRCRYFQNNKKARNSSSETRTILPYKHVIESSYKCNPNWVLFRVPIKKAAFKLHLDTGIEAYQERLPSIIKMLTIAAKEGVIRSFKCSKWVTFDEIKVRLDRAFDVLDQLKTMRTHLVNQKPLTVEMFKFYELVFKKEFIYDNVINELNSKINEIKLIIASRMRLSYHPVTIYLPEEIDYEKLAALCCALESHLEDVPSHARYLSEVDLPVLPHVSFRQDYINDNYVSVTLSTDQQKQELYQGATQSKVYKELQEKIQIIKTVTLKL